MVVDSSVWVEIFLDGPKADACLQKVKLNKVSIPAIVLYEVYKKFKEKGFEELALQVVAYLSKYEIINIDSTVALTAADVSLEYGIPMADSLVYSCAQCRNDNLFSLDNDFKDMPRTIVI